MRALTRLLIGLAFGPALLLCAAPALASPMICPDAPADERDQIEAFVIAHYETFVVTLADVSRISADPTLAGLPEVEAEMEAIRVGFSEEGMPRIAAMYGVFIGEVTRDEAVRAGAQACWTSEAELPEALRHGVPILRITDPDGEPQYAFSISTAFQHLENGAEDSPTFAVKALLASIRDVD